MKVEMRARLLGATGLKADPPPLRPALLSLPLPILMPTFSGAHSQARGRAAPISFVSNWGN